MKRASIFEGAIRGEDSYTNLLRNLMYAEPLYGITICKLLCPEELAMDFAILPEISAQVFLKTLDINHGRADLLIETKSTVLLVEVKTELYCPLTEKQNFTLDDIGNPQLRGYLQYLECRRQKGDNAGVCVLAPRSWRHRAAIERQFKELRHRGIPARLTTWEAICSRTLQLSYGQSIKEFGAFLESNFMTISFTPEEASLCTSDAGLKACGSFALKLHELVKQATKQLKLQLDTRDITRFEIRDLWADAKEHGATIFRNDKQVLWFGIWGEANWPLVVAFKEKWGIEENQLDLSGLSPISNPIHNWKVFQLPTDCFEGDEPLDHLISALLRVLRVE